MADAVLQQINQAREQLLDLTLRNRLLNYRPPFTQDALNKWLDEVLARLDVSAFMSISA